MSDSRRVRSRGRLGTAALLAAVLAGSIAGTGRAASPARVEERTLVGLTIRIAVRGLDEQRAGAALDRAFAEAERVALLLRLENETSELGILNHVPMRIAIAVSPETARVLRQALAIAAATAGAYDPTLPPLLDLWGVSSGQAVVPRQVDIDAALRKVYWEDIIVEEEQNVASRNTRRTRIDLDEVGAGAILDAALAALRASGATGGHVATTTLQAVYGGPWTLRLGVAEALDVDAAGAQPKTSGPAQDETSPPGVARPDPSRPGRSKSPAPKPDSKASGPAGSVELVTGAIAIALPRVRLTAEDGSVVHDRIDPRSGKPALETRWVAVSAADAAQAAAYASAVFVMGDAGRAFVEARDELEAVIALEAKAPWVSPGFRLRKP